MIGDKLQGFPCFQPFKSHVNWQVNCFPIEVLFSHKPTYSFYLQLSILHRLLMSFLLKNSYFNNNKCHSLSLYTIPPTVLWSSCSMWMKFYFINYCNQHINQKLRESHYLFIYFLLCFLFKTSGAVQLSVMKNTFFAMLYST